MENDLRKKVNDKLRVRDGYKLPYSSEILKYNGNDPIKPKFMKYETDILISEEMENNEWKPRVIIEAKINSITTHDALLIVKNLKLIKMYIHIFDMVFLMVIENTPFTREVI